MSAALVPGLIRLFASSSIFRLLSASNWSSLALEIEGLCGPNCSSGMGGGDGNLGELDDDTPVRAGETVAMMKEAERGG
jgi:hypothetical protein